MFKHFFYYSIYAQFSFNSFNRLKKDISDIILLNETNVKHEIMDIKKLAENKHKILILL